MGYLRLFWDLLNNYHIQLVKSKEECTQAISRYKNRDGEQGNTQGIEIQSYWISPELLEVIELVPYHEHFIHTYEGALPRGQKHDISSNYSLYTWLDDQDCL